MFDFTTILEPVIVEEPSPYPHLPTYCALMMCRNGGMDLEDVSPAGLERQVRQYIREYGDDDIEWNSMILRLVEERRFRPYGPGRVCADWPGEDDPTIH